MEKNKQDKIGKKYDDLGKLADEVNKVMPESEDKNKDNVITSLNVNNAQKALPAQDEEPALEVPKTTDSSNNGLLGAVDILKEAWTNYKAKFKDLIILAVLPLIVTVVLGLALGGSAFFVGAKLGVIVGVVIGVISVIVSIWAQVATIMVVDGQAKWKDSLKSSLRKVWLVFLVGVVTAVAVLGGAILFVIPGIILAIFLIFSTYVLVLENKGVWESMLASKAYVNGRWWPTFWRYIFIIFLLLIINFLANIIPVLGSIVSILAGPLVVAYLYSLYKNLKSSSKGLSEAETKKTKTWLTVFIVIGLFLGLGLIVFLPSIIRGIMDSLPNSNFTNQLVNL